MSTNKLESTINNDLEKSSNNFIEILEYQPVGIVHDSCSNCWICRGPLEVCDTKEFHDECVTAYKKYNS